jgi:hypothetical protein
VQLREALQSAAHSLSAEFSIRKAASWRAGDTLGLLALSMDPNEGVSKAAAEALRRLLDVAVEMGVEIYDPQRSAIATTSDIKIRSRRGEASAAQRLQSVLSAVAEPHGFRTVRSLWFSRGLGQMVQHLDGRVTTRGEELPNRIDLRAGWTLDFANSDGRSAEEAEEFTYMENMQTIAGKQELLRWKTESEFEQLLTYIQHTLERVVLPWLDARNSVDVLLHFYWKDPSRTGNGLYFGAEPYNHWTVAQIFRDRKDTQLERDALRNLISSPDSGDLIEAASARLRELE